ncbi:MAG: flagellin [Phycisphaerales bacterium]
MTILPGNISRVPNLLWSRLALGNLGRTNLEYFKTQQQLSSGVAITKPSDDPVKAATIGVLNERLMRSEQSQRNLQHATSNLNVLDSALDEANTIALDARSIASTELSVLSDPEQRRQQAVIVDQLLESLMNTTQRQGPAGYLFGGSITSRQPIATFGGGYRYIGDGPGLVTDTVSAGNVPITLGSGNPITATAARVKGSVDLNPRPTADTRLADFGGARGAGISLGTVEFSFNSGPRVQVDLAGADTIGDVVQRLSGAINQYEADSGLTVLGPGGISYSNDGLQFHLTGGSGGTLEFFDLASGTSGLDLGLRRVPAQAFNPSQEFTPDLRPKLTWRSSIGALQGVTGALGSIRINNLGQTAVVDLSTASTLEDIRAAIESSGMGIRVVINAEGTGIDVLNETAGSRDQAMSIEEVAGSNLTATRLGIRSFSGDTRIADFNDGRGVKIVDGNVDPTTGLADPGRDIDFTITLGDAAGTTIDVDLRPEDMATVDTVITRIRSEISTALTAAGLPATALQIGLTSTTNGLLLFQDPTFPGAILVTDKNNSPAASQLGLMDTTYDPATGRLLGSDTAKVRVNSLFTHLIDLRDALNDSDTAGITLAGENIEQTLSRLAETRGLVGGYAQRVESAASRESDRAVIDESIRSDLRDVDFAAAATRFSLLQTQLEASLRVTAQGQQLTLLDFLR